MHANTLTACDGSPVPFNTLATLVSVLRQTAVCHQVNYFNEVHAVWEPLIERVDGGRRRWNLELEVSTADCVGEVCVMVTTNTAAVLHPADKEQPGP